MINYDIEQYCCEGCFITSTIETMLEIRELKESNYSSVTIMCKTELCEMLIKLLGSVEINGFGLDFLSINFDKYDYEEGEYAITIFSDGQIAVDKSYYDSGELQPFEADVVYISDECSSKVLIHQSKLDSVIECFGIGEVE